MTLLCELGAPAVTALMLSNEASPTISPSHLPVRPPDEGTHEIPQPPLGHSMHTLTALCMVSSTVRLRQTLTCQAAGVVTAIGQEGQAEESGKWQERTHAAIEGRESQQQPAAKRPIWPMRATPDPYLPGRTSDHQDCVPPRSWRHAGESREQDREQYVLSKAGRRKA